MRLRILTILTMLALIGATPIWADIIDFESGFADLQPVGVVATATNTVTFSITGGGTAFIAMIGNPTTGFAPADSPAGAVGGNYFLSDEADVPLDVAASYFMSFAVPVESLSLHLYDFRGDGGAPVGSVATLSLWADAAMTILVGSTSFTSVAGMPDGSATLLSIPSVSSGAVAASLTFSAGDVGTGIDNINFSNVPEPSAFLLLGTALVAVIALRHKTRKA